MSDPFQDSPAGGLNDKDIDRGASESPVKAAPTTKRTLKLKNSGVKPEDAEPTIDKTPKKKKRSNTEFQEPTRKSSRTPKKRTLYEAALSDAEIESPTPLAKKARKSKAANVSPVPAPKTLKNVNTDDVAATHASAKLDKKAAAVSKSKASPTPAIKAEASSSKTTIKTAGKKRAATPDEDENGDESDLDERPKGKKRQKTANIDEAIFKEFEATAEASGKGSSTEQPKNATRDEPWKCANRMCSTGMTWCAREEIKDKNNNKLEDGHARKVCSHWFGRNKKETGYIHQEVWHFFCRKCYQRQAYQAKTKKDAPKGFSQMVKISIEVLRMQIIRLQLFRPQMTFKVQLVKGGKTVLAEYRKALAKPGATEADAIDAIKFVTSKTSKGKDSKPKAEHVFPIKQIEHFDYTFVGAGKTFDDLVAICDWTDDLNEKGLAPCDPPIEFLPSLATDDETVIDPLGDPDNYDRWAAYCDRQAQESDSGEDDDDSAGADDDDADDDDADDDGADEDDNGGDGGADAEDDQEDDDETIDAPLTDHEGSDDPDRPIPSIERDDNDDDPSTKKASVKSSAFLKATQQGRKSGLKGTGYGVAAQQRTARDEQRVKRVRERTQRECEEFEKDLAAANLLFAAEGRDGGVPEWVKRGAPKKKTMTTVGEDDGGAEIEVGGEVDRGAGEGVKRDARVMKIESILS